MRSRTMRWSTASRDSPGWGSTSASPRARAASTKRSRATSRRESADATDVSKPSSRARRRSTSF